MLSLPYSYQTISMNKTEKQITQAASKFSNCENNDGVIATHGFPTSITGPDSLIASSPFTQFHALSH